MKLPTQPADMTEAKINVNNSREGRTIEMDILRDLYFSIIDCNRAGGKINDEIERFLAALNVADHDLVCRVANFIAGNSQARDSADSTRESTLPATWDTLLERLIPWLGHHGYEKRGIHWRSPPSA
jgi:hypothetical protein